MDNYMITVYHRNETQELNGLDEAYESDNPYRAAYFYDFKTTFANIMSSEKFSKMKGDKGNIEICLFKNGELVRSKLHFLKNDAEKSDKRASKIINF